MTTTHKRLEKLLSEEFDKAMGWEIGSSWTDMPDSDGNYGTGFKDDVESLLKGLYGLEENICLTVSKKMGSLYYVNNAMVARIVAHVVDAILEEKEEV
jgi:hypothetical protein